MKRFLILIIAILMMTTMVGCSGSMASTEPVATETETPVNYLEATKGAIHDELFKESTEATQKIINRLFKDLQYEVIESYVDGEDAVVIMSITNINAGKAWVIALENYAKVCAENLFAESYMSSDELYAEYLEVLEDTFKDSDFVTTLISVEMELENKRWVCDIDDEFIDAVTGNLLSAMEGKIHSEIEIPVEPEVDDEDNAADTPISLLSEEVTLIDNDMIKVIIEGVTYEEVGDDEILVYFYIENKNPHKIHVTWDDFSCNDYMTDWWGYTTVSGERKERSYLELAWTGDPTELEEIGFNLSVWDAGDEKYVFGKDLSFEIK